MDTTEKRKLFNKIKNKSKEKPQKLLTSQKQPESPVKKSTDQEKKETAPKNANIFIAKKMVKQETNERTEKTSVSKVSKSSSRILNQPKTKPGITENDFYSKSKNQYGKESL